MPSFHNRVQMLGDRLSANDADGAIVSTGPNAYYFTGFAGESDRHLLLLITPDGKRKFISSKSYAGQVRDNTCYGDVVSVPNNTAESIVSELVSNHLIPDGTYFLDDQMRTEMTYRIQKESLNAKFKLLSDHIIPMRIIKDEPELTKLQHAARLTDEVATEIQKFGADAVGMTEKELAVEIRTRLHERGCIGESFPTVVAAGPNGARPTEYRHGERKIKTGEPVIIDFGGFFDQYASDQTRTVIFDGDPPDRFVEAYNIVHEALEEGIRTATPGTTGHEIDTAVREVIENAGYGEQFTTGTGHGVGLRAHEPPSISSGSKDELEQGMVFSIEPGIYFEGEWGVRLETVVALTAEGPEKLNEFPNTWEPL